MIALDGVPGTAQPAIQEGKYVAGVIRGRLQGHQAHRRFHYVDLGMMAVIGRTRAVADLFGKVRVGGFPAFLDLGDHPPRLPRRLGEPLRGGQPLAVDDPRP